jgi:hypothetical protein
VLRHLFVAAALLGLAGSAAAQMNLPFQQLETELVARYGEPQRVRVHRGLAQVARFWRPADGDAKALESFVKTSFAGDAQTLDALFSRMEFAFESINGHMGIIGRDLRQQADLDLGPIYPFDEILAGYDASAHVNDDLFQNKLAFVVLLNFPLTTLEQRLNDGASWTRRQWAETRLAEMFSKRIPAEVNAANAKSSAEAEQYVSTYNIWMHHVVDDGGDRLFPPKMRLLEHWNLRDEIKADYADKTNGLAKQRTIARIMERIVDQTIPNNVVDNPAVDWNPATNAVKPAAEKDAPEYTPQARIETPSSRYATIVKEFRAAKLVDPYSPTAPTLIERRFNEGREIPEARVRAMLQAVLTSPLVPRVARVIEQRLGRPLEPFDIWYNGFQPQGQYTGVQLDEITRKRYPTAAAYHADMPRMFEQLGFAPETAKFLAGNIVVDPARGSGHAHPSSMRSDHPHLRTRVGRDGMDYKGYNIAVHEMGHNVEQTFSMNEVDDYTLSGVPNTAFTEALAFVFQKRDLELLGLAKPSAQSRALETLTSFWDMYEKCGVSLVDMEMWHWMYDHPNATAPELNGAVVQIAKDIWNRYYAPVFKTRDVTLLAIYAHMVDARLYLPDYAIAHMINFQIEQQMEKAGTIGKEFERMAKEGRVTPDLWMRNASGAPVGPEALLNAAAAALEMAR